MLSLKIGALKGVALLVKIGCHKLQHGFLFHYLDIQLVFKHE